MATSRGPALKFLFLCVLGALVQSSLATTYKLTWSIPSSTTFYDDWASSKTFLVGDVIEFDYNFGAHDVLLLLPKDAATCDTSAPLQTWSAGSPKVSLDKAGTISFVCGLPNHCSLGMKLTVKVLATSTTATSPPPSPPTPVLPPPTPKRGPAPPPPTAAPPTPAKVPPTAAPPPPRRSKSSPAPAPAAVVQAPAKAPANAPSKAPSKAPAPGPAKATSDASAVRSTAAIAFFATLVVSFSAFLL
ncbi:hypothetical protein R1sor_007005 [Riccia sorocarpa]|uniref:Phytocyanin domain-containing protein n=1 Tax=Riccia sorocarpa TaxID=122646 RepID=A0ABD3HS16_9MARC